LLFTVAETFTVPGRGVCLLPELTPGVDERFEVGDSLRLRRPNGAEDSVRIAGLEFLKRLDGPCPLVVMLSGVCQEDVPIGTEVWSIDQSPCGRFPRYGRFGHLL
jgi:hypothetical protein